LVWGVRVRVRVRLTLTLEMVEAFKSNVVCPNKHASEPEVFYKVGMGG